MTNMIDSVLVKKIIDTAKIEDVIGQFLDLKKSGVRYLALCPFHDDRHIGSFSIYPRGNCYKCFACGEKGDSVDFLMNYAKMSFPEAIRWLGKLYGICVDDEDVNIAVVERPKPKQLPTLSLGMGMVAAKEHTENDNLCNWIRTGVKWDAAQMSRVEKVLKDYHVGITKFGHTIMWQIDEEGVVRTGKMMKYKTNGRRDRESSWNFDYVHSALIRKIVNGETVYDSPWPWPQFYNPDVEEARTTLFGLHLLNRYPHATVKIVESEKTAMLMAIAYGNSIMDVWMACGGMSMITAERLSPIIRQRRNIILYPDRDGVDAWKKQAASLNYDKVFVDDKPVTKWWKPCDGDKADIGDVVTRMLNESTMVTTAEEAAKKIKGAQQVIKTLELTEDGI